MLKVNIRFSRHSREGGNPQVPRWIPAYAGMTGYVDDELLVKV
jgi:hypothetical protein